MNDKDEKVRVKVVQPLKYNGELYTPGKIAKIEKTVVDVAPWCFEILEESATDVTEAEKLKGKKGK